MRPRSVEYSGESCSVDGCDKPYIARGYCGAHWWKWKTYGDPLGGGRIGRPRIPYAHGPEYQSWKSMRQRCLNPTATGYKNYGGRGVTICERWSDFRNFYADMGPRPKGTSLDRIDVNGNYEPGNCRWATDEEQRANRRPKGVVPNVVAAA